MDAQELNLRVQQAATELHLDAAPVVTIFVRHSADCKYAGDEFERRCKCRKHFRYTFRGRQIRRSAGTRSWAEADRKKRQLEDALAGRKPVQDETSPESRLTVEDAAETFLAAKRESGIEPPTFAKLQLTVDRIRDFCTKDGLHFLDDVNLTHVSNWQWSKFFNTTHSRRNNQERVRSFFKFFHDAGRIRENPAKAWKRVKGKTEQVSGFEPKEYAKVLAAIPKCGWTDELERKMRALVQLMRYAGLAILDASCLERSQIHHPSADVYRVQLTSRQKTSKKDRLQAIDNAIPPQVGRDLVSVLNGNPRYVFWNYNGNGEASDAEKRSVADKYWQRHMRTLLDKAGFPDATSHKFRHTLAIDMIRHGATFEDVAAALGNTVGVVARFYSHEWAKVRQSKTDDALQRTWGKQ